MNPQALAQEIIDGRRLTRQDDLKAFLTCDCRPYVKAQIKSVSILSVSAWICAPSSTDVAAAVRKTANSVRSPHITTPIARFTASCRRRIS